MFHGDSSYLTPVQFRQMAGRAGRRGFDLEGRVIFQGVTLQKVSKLLAAPLYPLHGHMHFKPTLLLRYLVLLHNTDKQSVKETVKATLRTLLQGTLDAGEREEEARSGRRSAGLSLPERHFRACLELLFRLGLIDRHTRPIGLAGLVTHLDYHEPANLALAHLLHTGTLTRCVAHAHAVGGWEVAGRRLMMLLAHLFNPVLLPSFARREDYLAEANSIVLLPSVAQLDANVAADMARFNGIVLEAYADVAHAPTAIMPNRQGGPQSMPGAGASAGAGTGPLDGGLPLINQKTAEMLRRAQVQEQPQQIQRSAVDETLRSLLRGPGSSVVAAGSVSNMSAPGAGRRSYPSLQSLLLSLPLHTFDSSAIPVLQRCDPHGRPFQLNSYAYDYYQHGIYPSILRVNRLADSTAFALLSDWRSTLATVAAAVRQVAEPQLLEDAQSPTSILVRALAYVENKFRTHIDELKRAH